MRLSNAIYNSDHFADFIPPWCFGDSAGLATQSELGIWPEWWLGPAGNYPFSFGYPDALGTNLAVSLVSASA